MPPWPPADVSINDGIQPGPEGQSIDFNRIPATNGDHLVLRHGLRRHGSTLGRLEVLIGHPDQVRRADQHAMTQSTASQITASQTTGEGGLESCRSELKVVAELGLWPEAVAAGLEELQRVLPQAPLPSGFWTPQQVILFSGHMMDQPDRIPPRFPADKEGAATERLDAALDRLGVGPDDLALAQAAAGGDLLFLEACLRRGVRCQVLLPFPEAEFIEHSILQSINGAQWRARYDVVRQALREQVEVPPLRIMPEALGPTPEGQNPFERCNLWLLNSALALGIERVRFLTLWDGGGGDGPGGTAHMVEEIQRLSGQIIIIDPRTL